MGRIDELWPLFGLRVRIGDLELRPPCDRDLAELADLTREPIHDPAVMPFYEPWTDRPEDERVRSVLQWNWRSRAEWTPDDWRLGLVALHQGRIVGTQGMHARNFALTREVETGSWLGRRFQGQGIGRCMRQAVLHLAFAGLGARSARSGAFSDNLVSLAVSERLGYSVDGTDVCKRRDERVTLIRLVLLREEWERRAPEWPAVTVDGLGPCLPEFGLSGTEEPLEE